LPSSIRFKINLAFVLIVSALLLATGWLKGREEQRLLETQFSQYRSDLNQRLQTSLGSPMWNYDSKIMSDFADSVFKVPVVGLAFFDERNKQPIVERGLSVDSTDPDVEWAEVPLFIEQNNGQVKVGRAAVAMSRATIRTVQRDAIISRVVEVVVLDILLVLALSFILQRLVLTPLDHLRMSFDEAAAHQSHDEPILMTVERNDEIGQVQRGFNRLGDDLALRQAQEQEIRRAFDDLKRTQSALIENEKLAALGGLVAGVAHEINTPLGITLTGASHLDHATKQFSTQMAEGKVKRSDMEAYLVTIRDSMGLILTNAERAANLVHSFKQVAVDQTSEARREFILAEYVNEVIDSLRPRLRRSAVTLEIDIAPNINLDSYPGAFAQVLTNIVLNAVIHAFTEGEPGTIVLRGSTQGDWAKVEFIDNGRGIPAENINRVFEPFFTTRRGSGGSGLGLNIVYNIVTQKLGGKIDVRSTVGEGATFTVTFPLNAATV
jgi:two-component system, NtrC family, sensor kinase